MKFSAGVFESAQRADALLISCGALKAIDLVVPLEERCQVPVVSSTPHALWSGVVARNSRLKTQNTVTQNANTATHGPAATFAATRLRRAKEAGRYAHLRPAPHEPLRLSGVRTVFEL